MKNLTLENITRVCGGVYYGPEKLAGQEVQSIITDSRKTEPGCLFVPIVGERVDPHGFIPQVMEAGALASLSERPLSDVPFPYILVASTRQAVKDIAEFYLQQLQIPVVGITGSVGKTSTKEAIASVLKEKFRTLKTDGNFNNELGLPLTVFRLRDEDEIAVLEMGISDFGEMSRLAKIARPDTCVITNIGTCHLENLGDRDGVFRAKTEAFAYVKAGGHIVLNGDDDKLSAVTEYGGIRPVFFSLKDRERAGSCERSDSEQTVSGGLQGAAGVWADQVESHGFKGTACRIHIGEKSFSVMVPVPGIHMVYNALAGAAVGHIYGLTEEEIKWGIESLETIGGRFKMVETGKFLVVDDCYNANPMSMKASLDVLKEGTVEDDSVKDDSAEEGSVKGGSGRRVAILGDMGELGKEEIALHRQVGAHAASCGIDVCICVGRLSRYMAEEASACKKDDGFTVLYEPDRESLLEHLQNYVRPGDTILVKASHFMKFEEVVRALEEM